MNSRSATNVVLAGLVLVFATLCLAFLGNFWGNPGGLPPIPLVDPQFTNTATARTSLADLMRAKADLSDFDCYTCHEKNKPPPLRFDAKQQLIIPDEHKDIVMAHGRHNRNNLC